MKKQEVLALIEDLPEEIDADQLLYALYIRRKIEIARAEARAGNIVSQEEIDREFDAWPE